MSLKHKKKTAGTPSPANTTPSSPRLARAQKRAQRRAEKKQAREAVLPVHKRPIVCPPDKAGRHLAFRVSGYICRALVIWAATAGLTIFISSAMGYGIANKYIMGVSLLVVALCALFAYGRIHACAASALAVGLAAWKIITRPRLLSDALYALFSLYNGCLERLSAVGYLSYVKYKAPIHTSTPTEDLLKEGVALLIILFATVFTFCLIRRVRMIPPAVMSTTFLVFILTFNVYSNRIQTNLGIAMVIVSFAAVLVMSAFDRLYRVKDSRRYDTDVTLFEDSDRPTLPEAYRAKIKRGKRRKGKGDVPAMDPAAPAEASAAGRLDKKERRAMAKQVKAVRRYDRITEQSRSAMGGFMAMAALLLCTIAVAFPALFIKGNFSTIDAIDEKMAFARDYVTAVLRGDDQALDELEYKADKDNFKDHSSELEQLEFTGKQIFYVETRYNTNYYLSGWIGTDYINGAWTSVDDRTLDDYRSLFSTSQNPSETLRYRFYHYMMPSLVDADEYNQNLLTKYKGNLEYGFVNVLVHLRRVNSPSALCYFPATFAPDFGVMDYGTVEESPLTYVNYYDGIRTGRKFKDNVSYATMTYAPLMTNPDWASNVGKLAASYAAQKEALLIRTYLPQNLSANQAGESRLTLTVTQDEAGNYFFTYNAREGKETVSWTFCHAPGTVVKRYNEYEVTTAAGKFCIAVGGSTGIRVFSMGISDSGSGSPYLIRYYEGNMKDDERSTLMDTVTMDWKYSDFVYRHYTQKGGSQTVSDLAKTILAQLHTEEQQIVTIPVEYPDAEDGEEYESSYEKIVWVNVPVSLPEATLRNSTSREAVSQRDLLVRNVIDYLIDEMGCKYTITPDLSTVDSSLDGVDNFLLNTHEGYCVQFASAVALILREYGIPARYVEGYIATGLTKQSRTDFVYGGYVHDYEAHAWVEVYFDGLGWIQYETTPQYYGGMYGVKNSGIVPSSPPPVFTPDPAETTRPEETTRPNDDETETDSGSEETTLDPFTASPELLRDVGVTLLIMLGIVAVIMIISFVIRKARESEEHRQSLVAQIHSDHFGENTGESDRREMSLEMVDAVRTLLRLYGLTPKPGEFRDEYADRLVAEFSARNGDDHRSDVRLPLPDLHRIMEAMAAEEFGHGMTIAEMKEVASLYLYLRQDIKKYLPLSERIKLRYIKHLI